MMRYFARRGWDVCEAEDGEAATRVLAPNVAASFTLVICDLRMPSFSGVELYQWLLGARPDVIDRLVFSTGDTECLETVTFLREVRRPVLAKPFELVELARIVDAASTSARAA
jgi:DNA-binding response OmpR family regulator